MSLGINTALRALEAEQAAINVTSHNVANATTAGYSRQIVNLVTTDPVSDATLLPAGAGQMGTGVQVGSIQRAHDSFVQQQIVYQNGQQAKEQGTSQTLDNISQIFNEPTDKGFGTLLSGFFTSWQSLANNSSDDSVRASVLASGQQLANGFQSAAGSLAQMQSDEDKQVGTLVTQINGITGQIATLNQQIVAVKAVGQAPNDLQDKRDLLLNQLSSLVGVQANEGSNGATNISLIGGGALVQGTSSFNLGTEPKAGASQLSDVVFANSTNPITVSGGQLGGAITDRDTTIQSRIAALDTLAGNVVSAVNAIHVTGFGSANATYSVSPPPATGGGNNFFAPPSSSPPGITAATMAVDPGIVVNPSNIVGGSALGQPADGSVALKIAQLAENPPGGVGLTLSAQYNSMINRLGVDGQQVKASADTGALVLQQLTAQQSSVSGVSTNEESSNLLQYQAAYEAAARVIAIMNQTMSDMITQLGG
jgi:flagellar hook-associated protein 1 FlgK